MISSRPTRKTWTCSWAIFKAAPAALAGSQPVSIGFQVFFSQPPGFRNDNVSTVETTGDRQRTTPRPEDAAAHVLVGRDGVGGRSRGRPSLEGLTSIKGLAITTCQATTRESRVFPGPPSARIAASPPGARPRHAAKAERDKQPTPGLQQNKRADGRFLAGRPRDPTRYHDNKTCFVVSSTTSQCLANSNPERSLICTKIPSGDVKASACKISTCHRSRCRQRGF